MHALFNKRVVLVVVLTEVEQSRLYVVSHLGQHSLCVARASVHHRKGVNMRHTNHAVPVPQERWQYAKRILSQGFVRAS